MYYVKSIKSSITISRVMLHKEINCDMFKYKIKGL